MNQEELKIHVHNLIFNKVKTLKTINQKSLAEKCNVSEMTVSKWLRDNNPSFPSADIIPDLCSALNITILDFFGISTTDETKALELYKAYVEHPDRQESVNVLLEIK